MTSFIDTIPDRPIGVPHGARYFPPAPDFSELEEFNKTRPNRRAHLRISVPFVVWHFHGVALRAVHHRALSVRKRTWSMGRCLIFNDAEKTPGVWAWTLADERTAGDS